MDKITYEHINQNHGIYFQNEVSSKIKRSKLSNEVYQCLNPLGIRE